MGSIYKPKYRDRNGKRKESNIYWIKYARGGKVYRESSGSENKIVAGRLLKLREGQIAEGRFPGLKVQKTRIGELADLYQKDYRENGRKSMNEANRYASLLREHFGELRAADLTTTHMMDYREKRRAEGAKDSTINREISALRRMFHLGLKHDPPLVSRIPHFHLVRENNVRKGFFEIEDFLALRGALPDHLKIMATIGYYTGMRFSEIVNLRWDQVDWHHRSLRLDPGTTKTNEGRTIPMVPELHQTLEQWRKATIAKWPSCSWICQRNGNPIKDHRHAWKTACKRVGLEGRLFHDLRRSAVRNLIRAGVPQVVAKGISGHKTDAVFNRYNIVSDTDLSEAVGKLSRYIQERKAEIQAGQSFGQSQNGAEKCQIASH